MLKFVLLELSEPANTSKLQHWSQQLASAVILAGANWDWCVELVGSCLHNVELVELVRRVLKEVPGRGSGVCTIISDHEVAALTLLLPHAQPRWLSVFIPPTEPTPPHLGQLVGQLSPHFTGWLYLLLHHSYLCYEPCDKVVRGLTKAR